MKIEEINAIIYGVSTVASILEPYIAQAANNGEVSNAQAAELLKSVEALKALQRAGGPKGPEWEQSHRLGKDKLPLPELGVEVKPAQ